LLTGRGVGFIDGNTNRRQAATISPKKGDKLTMRINDSYGSPFIFLV